MISVGSEKKAGQTLLSPFIDRETETQKDLNNLPKFSRLASKSTRNRTWVFPLLVHSFIEPFSKHLLKA